MAFLARTLRDLGLHDDRYAHPELWIDIACPAVRPSYVPPLPEKIARAYRNIAGFEGDEAIDLRDDGSVRSALSSRGITLSFPEGSAADAGRDIGAATRFILNLLRQDDVQFRRFPDALSAGAEGGFCRWLCGSQDSPLAPTAGAAECVRASFLSRPGDEARRALATAAARTPALRLAGLPHARLGTMCWLATSGKSEYGLTDASIWWFLLEAAEDPARELAEAYRNSEHWWPRFPDALSSAESWSWLARWARDRYGLTVSESPPGGQDGVADDAISLPGAAVEEPAVELRRHPGIGQTLGWMGSDLWFNMDRPPGWCVPGTVRRYPEVSWRSDRIAARSPTPGAGLSPTESPKRLPL